MWAELAEQPIISLNGSEKTVIECHSNNPRYTPVLNPFNDEAKTSPFGSENVKTCEDLIVTIPEDGKSNKNTLEDSDSEYLEENKYPTGSCWDRTISKKRVRRCLKMAIVIILAAFVPKAFSDIYHSSSVNKTDFFDEVGKTDLGILQIVPMSYDHSERATCKKINSPEGLLNVFSGRIAYSCIEIEKGYGLVSSLTEPAESTDEAAITEEVVKKHLSQAVTVQKLDIDARINEKWLGLLLTELKELKSVRLRMNGLCEGACVKDRNNLPPLELPNVTDLTLDSDSHLCDIITWVFRYQVPQLKTLTLKDIKFSRKTFEGLVNFLKSNNKGIESVTLQSCTLCRFGCDLNAIPEDNRAKLMYF